jgi:SAM-dependent methyltransferase
LGDDEDVGFYLSLSRKLAPRKVLELGCGTGRITLPLAQLGFDVVGLDNQSEMLQRTGAPSADDIHDSAGIYILNTDCDSHRHRAVRRRLVTGKRR